MEAGLLRLKDEVRFKRQYIVQEPPELVDFAADFDVRPSVIGHEASMTFQLFVELGNHLLVVLQVARFLKHEEVLCSRTHLSLFRNVLLNILLELKHRAQSLLR